MQPKLEARAKVRVGKKDGKYPSSVDYFICDDEEFVRICGEKPKRILIEFPYSEAADNWSDGLEWWVKTKGGANKLACYTKDGGSEPVALRIENFFSEEGWEERLGGPRGENRIPIKCPARSCPQLEEGKCKPMGRLVFFLSGGRTDLPLQIDTKSWHSCEGITAGVQAAMRRKPNLVGRVFALSVEMKQKGTSKFPVLSLEEVAVEVNTPSDVEVADALVSLGNSPTREGLAAYLDVARPGWREKEEFTARIREVGIDEAIKSILERAS